MNPFDRIRAVLDATPTLRERVDAVAPSGMARAMAAVENSPGRRAMAAVEAKAKRTREHVDRAMRAVAARWRITRRRIALAATRLRAKALAILRPAPRAPRAVVVRREATHPPGSLGEARTLITALTDAANAPPLLRASQLLARAA